MKAKVKAKVQGDSSNTIFKLDKINNRSHFRFGHQVKCGYLVQRYFGAKEIIILYMHLIMANNTYHRSMSSSNLLPATAKAHLQSSSQNGSQVIRNLACMLGAF